MGNRLCKSPFQGVCPTNEKSPGYATGLLQEPLLYYTSTPEKLASLSWSEYIIVLEEEGNCFLGIIVVRRGLEDNK